MIQVETQCPNCSHDATDHLEALPSERTVGLWHCRCLLCGCRYYLGQRRDEIGEAKIRREAEETDE